MSRIIINQPRTSYFIGGAEVVSMVHAKTLAELGHDVTFYTIKPASIQQNYSERFKQFRNLASKMPNLTITELDQDPRALDIYSITPGENKDRWYVEAMFYNRPLFEALLANDKPVDVLSSYYQFDALTIPSNKVRNNVLYILGIPSTENNLRSSQLRMYDKLFAINDKVKDYWQQYDQRQIIVAPTGVDIPSSPKVASSGSDLSIIFAGRLIERKGCSDLIEAVSQLPSNLSSKIRLTIIGDGPQLHELQELVNQKRLHKQIEFTGAVADPIEYFTRADVCVFPSQRGEGLMGVVLEAMAAGSCVVSTLHNGNEEVLSESRGVLYEPGDINALADVFIELLNDSAKRQILGAAARTYVAENYSWSKRTQELFNEIV